MLIRYWKVLPTTLAFCAALTSVFAQSPSSRRSTRPDSLSGASRAQFAFVQQDRNAIASRAADAVDALQRSKDTAVRRLQAQIAALERQISSSRGDVTALKRQLSVLQGEMLSRLAASDAQYALRSQAFVQAIGILFDSTDEKTLALLHRYAEGDANALAELQRTIYNSAGAREQRLVKQQAIAQLMFDASRRKEIDDRKAIAAYEDILDEDPDDFIAINNLYSLYVTNGQPERANSMARKMHRLVTELDDGSVPHAAAGSYHALALTSLRSGDLEKAMSFSMKSVEILRGAVSEGYDGWRSRHQNATEPAWQIENFYREHLAVSLQTLAEVLEVNKDYVGAAAAVNEASALRRLNIETELAARRKVSSVAYAYAENNSSKAGSIYAEAGDWTSALTAFRVSIELANAASMASIRESKSSEKPIQPYWVLIPFSSAALNSGLLDEAETALIDARQGMKSGSTSPSASLVGHEGYYWLVLGNLLKAQNRLDEAKSAWRSSEVALSQAIAADRDNEEWRKKLAQVETLLAVP